MFEDLERDVLNADALLWIIWCEPFIECAAVTQIVRTEKSKACMIQACGGSEYRRWIGLLEKIEKYAKTEGCRCTRIIGRKGWARVLKHYKETKIVLERTL